VTHRGPDLPYSLVAGVMPWRNKWVVASAKMHAATFACETPKVFDSFIDVLSEKPAYSSIVIHAPIGYRDRPGDPPRTCDLLARKLLGRRRIVVPFAPTYETLAEGASWEGARLDAVTVRLLPRYREVAAEMSPFRQRTVYSGNPDLSFFRLNGDQPLTFAKNRLEGSEERQQVLERRIHSLNNVVNGVSQGIPLAHLLDAAALLWTARLVFGHGARRLPSDPEWDSEGLRTELVY
jgi:predicted RNase H-like nuclease